jgi:hypothetical protein
MKYFLRNKNYFSCIVEMDADFSHNPGELKRNLNYFFSKKTDLLLQVDILIKVKLLIGQFLEKFLSFYLIN